MARNTEKTSSVSVDKLLAELRRLDARRQEIITAINSVVAPYGAAVARSRSSQRTGRRPGFKMSAAAKAKIAAAQRARWARTKKAQNN